MAPGDGGIILGFWGMLRGILKEIAPSDLRGSQYGTMYSIQPFFDVFAFDIISKNNYYLIKIMILYFEWNTFWKHGTLNSNEKIIVLKTLVLCTKKLNEPTLQWAY